MFPCLRTKIMLFSVLLTIPTMLFLELGDHRQARHSHIARVARSQTRFRSGKKASVEKVQDFHLPPGCVDENFIGNRKPIKVFFYDFYLVHKEGKEAGKFPVGSVCSDTVCKNDVRKVNEHLFGSSFRETRGRRCRELCYIITIFHVLSQYSCLVTLCLVTQINMTYILVYLKPVFVALLKLYFWRPDRQGRKGCDLAAFHFR